MPTKRIVIIEDDALIADSIKARLRSEGFDVVVAADGNSGIELCKQLPPCLVVLDVMLPGIDGLEVLHQLHQIDRSLPVLVLTARDSESDLIVGLNAGADDYMTKPFSPRELVARINAVLRRAEKLGTAERKNLTVGALEIDLEKHLVVSSGESVQLTPIEFDLLVYFAQRPGVVFNRDQLLADVWGYSEGAGTRTVDSHIGALRKKLGADVIRTVHGIGYSLGVE